MLSCQALPCAKAVDHKLAGPGHMASDYGTLGAPGLVLAQIGGVSVQESLGVLLAHWCECMHAKSL